MTIPRRRKFPAIPDYRARVYFERLKAFLGESGVDKRFDRLDRQLQSESGIYLKHWVIPRQAWWIGVRKAFQMLADNRSFRGALTRDLEYPFQTAVKLSRFHKNMPDWKKEEIRSRLLNDDFPDDVLFELDTAFHYYSLGYDIDWLSLRSEEGMRTAEFIASSGQYKLEVECKSKEADAGRKIERAAFYRIADLLLPWLQSLGLMGQINISIEGRLPTNQEWQIATVEGVKAQCKSGTFQATLANGTFVEIVLKPVDNVSVPLASIVDQMDPSSHPYAHHLIVGRRYGDRVTNPIIFRVESAKKDQFLLNVLRSLRDADDQFTGNHSAVICCRIPEIDSFEGLQQDSAIANMTCKYFADHSSEFIYAVTYVSEARRQIEGNVIISSMPALVFRSNLYRGDLPEDLPLSA